MIQTDTEGRRHQSPFAVAGVTELSGLELCSAPHIFSSSCFRREMCPPHILLRIMFLNKHFFQPYIYFGAHQM